MAKCKPTYRFLADIDGTVQDLEAWYDDELTKSIQRAQGRNHFTESLDGELIFVRTAYDTIAGLDIGTRVLLDIYVTYPGEDTEKLFFKGRFSKTDCAFDGDNRTVTVTLESNSGTKQVLDGINREYNLVDIAPETTAFKYTRQTILQVYIAGANFINNYVNGTNAEVPVLRPTGSGTPYGETELTDDYFFQPTTTGNIVYIPFYEGMSPDVSGEYEFTGSPDIPYQRTDGEYDIYYSGGRAVLGDFSDGEILYRSDPIPVLENFFADSAFEKSLPLRKVGSSDPDIFVYRLKVYARLLSPVAELDGTTANELPAEDIVSTAEGYRFVLPIDEVPTIIVRSAAQNEPTRFGRYASDATGLSGQYFAVPDFTPGSGFNKLYPVSPTQWNYYSVWFYYNSDLAGTFGDGQVIEVQDAYTIEDSIAALLAEFAPDVTFAPDAAHSEFLFGVNPFRGARKILFAPKSNIIAGEYDRAATRAEIRLTDIFELLLNLYNADWYVDSAGRLRIEHISWFDAGGTYGNTASTENITSLIEPQSGLAWTYRTGQWRYEKQDIPKRLEFSYMDKSSRAFEGHAIEVLSTYAQDENVQERPVSKFTADLDYIASNPSEISPDGFVVVETRLLVGDLIAPFVQVNLDNGEEYRLQNGRVAFTYAHENYFLDGMPAESINVNLTDRTASSVVKTKRQELDYAYLQEFDPVQLFTTTLGNGKLKTAEIDVSTLNVKITLLHDTE